MIVEVKPGYATNVATRERVYLGQYEIWVDGREVGALRDVPGSGINLFERISPLEQTQLLDGVEAVLKWRPKGVFVPPDPQSIPRPELDADHGETVG